MKFKFGDRVVITKEGFFKGVTGIIVEFQLFDAKNYYLVYIGYSMNKGFYEDMLDYAD